MIEITKKEMREIKLWLTEHIIRDWVKNGMTLDDAKALWVEMGEFK